MARAFLKYRFEYLLIAPSLLIVLLIIFYPIVYALDISLYETRFLEKVRFSGFDNYVAFFTSRDGPVILFNTPVLVGGSLLLTLPIGMGLALLVKSHISLKGFIGHCSLCLGSSRKSLPRCSGGGSRTPRGNLVMNAWHCSNHRFPA